MTSHFLNDVDKKFDNKYYVKFVRMSLNRIFKVDGLRALRFNKTLISKTSSSSMTNALAIFRKWF